VELERDYPEIAYFRLPGERCYMLSDPALIVEVFSRGREVMKGRALRGAKAVVGNGLLTSDGEPHLRRRRLAQPAFHRERIAGYSRDMVRITLECEQGWVDGAEVDISTVMSQLTFLIAGRTLFGSDLRGDAKEFGESLDAVMKGLGSRLLMSPRMVALDVRIPTPGRRQSLRDLATLDATILRMIDEHRAAGDTGDVLSMLIAAQEDGESMTDEQLRDEAMTMVLAAHETTSVTLSWTWMLLAWNPEWATWLHEELDSVLGGRDPGMDDLPNLPRTRAILMEAMRLYPAAWAQGRRLLVDMEVGGWTIPAGAMVFASPFTLHRSPRWWTDPLVYRPDRWINEDGAFDEAAPGIPKGVWFEFGWGNRKCIGEAFAWTEALLAVATLAQPMGPGGRAGARGRSPRGRNHPSGPRRHADGAPAASTDRVVHHPYRHSRPAPKSPAPRQQPDDPEHCRPARWATALAVVRIPCGHRQHHSPTAGLAVSGERARSVRHHQR
jgi:cytochrome P450